MSTSSSSKVPDLTPRLLMPQRIKLMMERLVANCSKEIYWFGFINQVEMGDQTVLIVYDLIVPEQEVSGSSVDMHGTMNKMMEDLIAEGRGDEISKIKMFCHSHVNMSAYHSGRDLEMLGDIALKLDLDWFISHVQNKKGETDTRFDMFKPFSMHVDEVQIISLVPADINKWAREQIEEKITVKSYGSTYTTGSQRHSPGRTNKIQAYDINKRWPDAKQTIVHVIDYMRLAVIDGLVREEENTNDGTWVTYGANLALDLDGWKAEFYAKKSSRRTEGNSKAPSSTDGAERLLLTQGASGARSDSQDESESDKPKQQSEIEKEIVVEGEVVADDNSDDDEQWAKEFWQMTDEEFGVWVGSGMASGYGWTSD